MSELPEEKPQQNLNISGDASLENTQIGGIAGRDVNVNQIQGKVVNLSIYDHIHAPDGLSQQSVIALRAYVRTISPGSIHAFSNALKFL